MTLALGGLGSVIASLLSLPLAWMLGALFMVMGCSLLGVRTAMDRRLHRVAIALLGLFIGSRIKAEELLSLVHWYPSVIAMVVYMAVILCGGHLLFKGARLGRMDAWFCAYPGSMNSALVLAERAGGDLRWIAMSHSLRLVTVVSGAALVASLLSDDVTLSSSAGDTGPLVLVPLGMALLLWRGGRALGMPIPEFLGPMAAGALAVNMGLSETLPLWLVLLAFMVIGTSVGTRFSGTQWTTLVSMGRFGIVFALFALLAAAMMAGLVALYSELEFVAVLLALAPGGVGEMAVIATVVGVDPVYVVSHHVLRMLLLIFMTPLMVRLASS